MNGCRKRNKREQHDELGIAEITHRLEEAVTAFLNIWWPTGILGRVKGINCGHHEEPAKTCNPKWLLVIIYWANSGLFRGEKLSEIETGCLKVKIWNCKQPIECSYVKVSHSLLPPNYMVQSTVTGQKHPLGRGWVNTPPAFVLLPIGSWCLFYKVL